LMISTLAQCTTLSPVTPTSWLPLCWRIYSTTMHRLTI
jgi:hypothetical protein